MTAELKLHVFVYGSLKRGGKYHSAYCRGYCDVMPARMLGRLYRQASGYAMLLVPPEHIVAHGTSDPLADAARLVAQRAAPPRLRAWSETGDWQWVEGEIFTFDDPAVRLPRLDLLEDFLPGRASLYDRVIAPAVPVDEEEGAVQFVWTYVAPGGVLPSGAVRLGTSWP